MRGFPFSVEMNDWGRKRGLKRGTFCPDVVKKRKRKKKREDQSPVESASGR